MTSIKRYLLADPRRLLVLLLALWWVVNLVQSAFMELHFDEAYYYMFSRRLDWGYFDHPPMTALLIRLGSLFNRHELGVRLFVTLLQPVYLYLFWTLLQPTTYRDVLLYILICAAVPMLQVYGFVATPDAPLMFFTVLLLVAYRGFVRSSSWGYTLLLGLTAGLLAYSKYHGALVVVCIALSNPKLLRNPRLYVAAGIALLVLLPHLLWQYHHEWASFMYHLMERNKAFRPSYIVEYLLNVWLCYNPIMVPLLVYAMLRQKARQGVERALYFITAGFFLFFLLSTLRGHVQPQWTLVGSLGLVAVLYRYALERPRARRWLMRTGVVSVALLLLLRVVVLSGLLDGTNLEFVGHRQSNRAIARLADGAPVLFLPSYKAPSLYAFYTRQPCATQLRLDKGRKSQYDLWRLNTAYAGQRVLLELPHPNDSTLQLTRRRSFSYTWEECYAPW